MLYLDSFKDYCLCSIDGCDKDPSYILIGKTFDLVCDLHKQEFPTTQMLPFIYNEKVRFKKNHKKCCVCSFIYKTHVFHRKNEMYNDKKRTRRCVKIKYIIVNSKKYAFSSTNQRFDFLENLNLSNETEESNDECSYFDSNNNQNQNIKEKKRKIIFKVDPNFSLKTKIFKQNQVIEKEIYNINNQKYKIEMSINQNQENMDKLDEEIHKINCEKRKLEEKEIREEVRR